jgi:hypothetical protein
MMPILICAAKFGEIEVMEHRPASMAVLPTEKEAGNRVED